MTHESLTARNRVHHDDILRERAAGLVAKFANHIVALGANATEEQKTWARYTLSDKDIPDKKATSMMWRLVWDPGVKNIATDSISDNTLSAIIEPHAINY